MPNILRLLVVSSLVVALPVAGQDAPVSIDARFEADVVAPGCASGVFRDGKVVRTAGSGFADLEHRAPITSASLFYTGSLSKQFTALAVALAEREGLLDVDDRLRRWIPELDASADGITLRHLIHHTGGLREKWDLLAMQGVPIERTVITQPMVIDLLARQRGVLFPAGDRYSYSNSGYDLLATAIERASGESFREFTQRRIFRPLRMTTARFGDDWGEVIPGRVMGYTNRGGQWQRRPAMVETVGSGSLYASVDDLLAWLAAWDRGLLGDSTLAAQLETPGRLASGSDLGYAWGLIVDTWQDRRRVHHTGSLAGYRTAMWRLPEQRWAAVVLCNSAEARPADMVEQLALRDFPVAAGGPVTDELRSMFTVEDGALPYVLQPEELVGEYWSDELQARWQIVLEDGALLLRRTGLADLPAVLEHGGRLRIGNWRFTPERDAEKRVESLRVDRGGAAGVRLVRR